MTKRTMLIGVTGGIGSGKSFVCQRWSRLSRLPRIDVDQLCRGLLAVGAPGWEVMGTHFGHRYFSETGQLRRKKLRHDLFADETLRAQLDQLLHPLAFQALEQRIIALDAPWVLVEVPLLFEAGWEKAFQHIVLVYANPVIRCQRIIQRDQVTLEAVCTAISAQSPLEEKVRRAGHVLDNSHHLLSLYLQMTRLNGYFNSKYESFSFKKA